MENGKIPRLAQLARDVGGTEALLIASILRKGSPQFGKYFLPDVREIARMKQAGAEFEKTPFGRGAFFSCLFASPAQFQLPEFEHGKLPRFLERTLRAKYTLREGRWGIAPVEIIEIVKEHLPSHFDVRKNEIRTSPLTLRIDTGDAAGSENMLAVPDGQFTVRMDGNVVHVEIPEARKWLCEQIQDDRKGNGGLRFSDGTEIEVREYSYHPHYQEFGMLRTWACVKRDRRERQSHLMASVEDARGTLTANAILIEKE